MSSSNSTLGDAVIPSNILTLVGPLLLGNLAGWLLFGVLTMQLYVYYLAFRKDRIWINCLVYGLYILDIIQTVFCTDIVWSVVCSGWGKPRALRHPNWGFWGAPIISGIISSTVQIFFAWRVWALGNNGFWKTVVMVISLTAMVQGLAAISAGFKVATSSSLKRVHEINVLIYIWLTGSVVTDILIASSMVYLLIAAKKKTTWSRSTNRKITKLIRNTVETGVVPAVAASMDLLLYVRYNHSYLHAAFTIVLSKVYNNALMASLNSRAGVYERDPGPRSPNSGPHPSVPCSTVQFGAMTSGGVTDGTYDPECGKCGTVSQDAMATFVMKTESSNEDVLPNNLEAA